MQELFQFVMRVILLVTEALVVFDETPEGHAMLNDLLSDIEKAGFDIPMWEPDPEEPPLDLNNTQIIGQAVGEIAKTFMERHPEIARKKAKQGSVSDASD